MKILKPRIEILYKQDNLIIPCEKGQLPRIQAIIEGIEDGEYEVVIEKKKNKRTVNANAYMWKLCGKLAEKLSREGEPHTKEEIYKDAIKKVGVWKDDEIEPEKVKWRRAAWEQIGTGWVAERVDFTEDGNKEIIRFYYGSSRYNKSQMSTLIDYLIQDCNAVGVQVLSTEELERLKNTWGVE